MSIDYLACRRTIREQGYLVVPGVFEAETVDRANAALDRVLAGDDTSYPRLAAERDLLAMLVDPRVLRLVAVCLHPAIQAQAFHSGVLAPGRTEIGGGWHQDGPMGQHLAVDGVAPLCNLAAGFILSDQRCGGRGNTRVVPGSHRRALDLAGVPAGQQVEGELELLAGPGDVVLFFGNLWHTASPNPSSIERRTVFSKWNFVWMHQIDPLHRLADEDPAWWAQQSPEAQQVLGGMYLQRRAYFQPQTLPLQAAVDAITAAATAAV